VALLRGINVGGRQKIAMADLQALLAGLRHRDVATLLQSGNALFTSARQDEEALALEIERAIARKLGLTVRCLVRGRDELRRVVDAHPLAGTATDPARLLVIFLSSRPDAAFLRSLDLRAFAPDQVVAGERELYVWCPDGAGKSKLVQALSEKRLGCRVATARNWNTVTKLLGLMTTS
jgi:uncharacterized protein (DUF1697 family)